MKVTQLTPEQVKQQQDAIKSQNEKFDEVELFGKKFNKVNFDIETKTLISYIKKTENQISNYNELTTLLRLTLGNLEKELKIKLGINE